jgi:hypothetical protein
VGKVDRAKSIDPNNKHIVRFILNSIVVIDPEVKFPPGKKNQPNQAKPKQQQQTRLFYLFFHLSLYL